MLHTKLTILLLACLPAICMGQTTHEHSACDIDSIDPMKEAILSEVTVEGITGTSRLQDASAPFTVISPATLHGTIGTNLIDRISNTPGLSQVSTGPGISKPVIRGMGYNRVVVVDNGIRQEGQQWGDEHGLEVDADGVHSVEVLKGPASLMYGSDAIAGVMVLHPERPLPDNTLQARVGGEYQTNNGLYRYMAGFSGNSGGVLWNLHYSRKAAHCYQNSRDGFVPGSWFKEGDLGGMLGLSREWGHTWLRFSHVSFTPGITEGESPTPTLPVGEGDETVEQQLSWEEGYSPRSYEEQLPFQRVKHTKVVSDNLWNLGRGTLKAIVGYQQNYRREYEEEIENSEFKIQNSKLPEPAPALAMRLHTVNYDVKYQLQLPGSTSGSTETLWKLAAGLGGMWQSNVNRGEEYLIPDYRLFDIGAFVTAGRQAGQWHLSGGVRLDNRSLTTDALMEDGKERFSHMTKHFTGVTGSLGAVYNLNDRMNLRLNVARGFRAPTVSELSSNGVHEGSAQYEVGNAALDPEYSLQTDLGMDYTSHVVAVNAALFFNRISNYIFLTRLPYTTEGHRTYQYEQGDAQLIGGEVSVDIHPIEQLHISNDFSFVRGIQLHQPEESCNLPMMPAPRWNVNVKYSLPSPLSNGASLLSRLQRTYVAANFSYTFRQDNYYALDDTETATADYGLVNLSVGTDLHCFGHNCIELSVTCQNLFDKAYQPHLSRLKYIGDGAGICAMGRNVCFKVSMPIDIHL